jgi:hypothetical protein
MARHQLCQAQQDLGQQLQVGAGLAAHAGEQPYAADAMHHLARLRRVERQHAEAHVLEHLHVLAAEAEHQQRPELGVGGDTEDHLVATARHLLHQEARDAMAGGGNVAPHLAERRGQLRLAAQIDAHRPRLALVHQVGRHALEHHRIADRRRRRQHLGVHRRGT